MFYLVVSRPALLLVCYYYSILFLFLDLEIH